MTAPAASTNGRGDSNNGSGRGGSNGESKGNSSSQADQNSRGQREQRTESDQDDHPELDDFVKGFYDGDKFTDVDSRVWV